MNPHIPFGVPLWLLRHIDQRLEFRKQLMNRAEFAQPVEPDRWLLGAHQKLFHLSPNALSRQVIQLNRSTKRGRVGLNIEFETGCKLCGPEHAQAVLRESDWRHSAQNSSSETCATATRIDDVARQRVLENRIDGKVPPLRSDVQTSEFQSRFA